MTTNSSINARTNHFVPLAGGTITGPIINYTTMPTLALELAPKAYVDATSSGFTFLTPCLLATTGSTLNATYNNGVAGVGATLTNAGANTAFSLDGTATSVNDRICVKDQTTTFQNGVYQVATVGNGATPWVLVRTTDFDTAAEIVPGVLVPITSGTLNAGATELQVATVTTVGTDPVTFVSFSPSPQLFLTKAANLSDVGSIATSRNNLITTNSLAYAKIQQVAAHRFLGNSTAGATNVTEVELIAGTNITLSPGATSLTIDAATGSGGYVSSTILTSGVLQTYTVPSNINTIVVEMVGGGGGGGGVNGGTGKAASAGSGGGGGYVKKTISVSPSDTFTYTVGTGGLGGAAGLNDGAAGNNTVFGAATANGGGGGQFQVAVSSLPQTGNSPGSGGASSGGDINSSGQAGTWGTCFAAQVNSGIGGSSFWGGGAPGSVRGIPGVASGNAGGPCGGGGSGAVSINTASSAGGGNGSAGLIVITELS